MQQQARWERGWQRLRPAHGLSSTLIMTGSVAVNCQACLKVENSIGFHCHPREGKFRGWRWWGHGPFQAPCHPESSSEAAYRCNTGTAAGAAGRGGLPSPPASLPALPKARTRPRRARRLLPPVSLRLCPGAVWKGSWEPSQAPQTRIWEGVGRGRGFPSNLRQGWLQESFSKFPAASAQVASAGRADGGKRASLAAASAASRALWAARSREAGRTPGGQAGPPPGAKAAADAGGSEGGSCPAPAAAPTPGAPTRGQRLPVPGARGGGPRWGPPGVPKQPSLPSTSPHSPFPPGPKLPGTGVAVGPWYFFAALSIPEPPTPSKFLPALPLPQQREGEGRVLGEHALS